MARRTRDINVKEVTRRLKSYVSYSSSGGSEWFKDDEDPEDNTGYSALDLGLFGFPFTEGALYEVTVKKLYSPDEKTPRSGYQMVIYTAGDGTKIQHYADCPKLNFLFKDIPPGLWPSALETTHNMLPHPLHKTCFHRRGIQGDGRHTFID